MNKSTRTLAFVSSLVALLSAPTLSLATDKHAGHDMSKMSAAGTIGDIPVNGTVHKIDLEKRSVNVTHDPIPAIEWPSMTMDLPVTKRVDLATIKPGMAVILTLKQGRDKQYRVTGITPRK